MNIALSESEYQAFLPIAKIYYEKLYKEHKLNNTDKIILENYKLQRKLSEKAMVESLFIWREDDVKLIGNNDNKQKINGDELLKKIIEYLKQKGIEFAGKLLHRGKELSIKTIKILIPILLKIKDYIVNKVKTFQGKLSTKLYLKVASVLQLCVDWLTKKIEGTNKNSTKPKEGLFDNVLTNNKLLDGKAGVWLMDVVLFMIFAISFIVSSSLLSKLFKFLIKLASISLIMVMKFINKFIRFIFDKPHQNQIPHQPQNQIT